MAKKRDWRTAKRQRNRGLTMRLSDAERAQIDAMASAADITPGAMVRAIVLNVPIPKQSRRLPQSSLKPELAGLLAELGKIGSNINQIAKVYNVGGSLPMADIQEELHGLKTLRLRLRQALAKG